MSPTVQAWTPRIVRFIKVKFAAPCYWCNTEVPAGSSAALYTDERAIAHDRCHREACT